MVTGDPIQNRAIQTESNKPLCGSRVPSLILFFGARGLIFCYDCSRVLLEDVDPIIGMSNAFRSKRTGCSCF